MKTHQVPQDEGTLSQNNMSELCYALDENGEFVAVSSTGWEPKTLALNESLKLIEERTAQKKREVLAGTCSPIAYFMELNRMDIALLASYVGIHRWFVKRHFHPKRFSKLSEKTLQKYARAFGVSMEELMEPFSNTQ